jgi:Ca2+/H+ antiporter, TMEM165/GDT1 family
MEAFLASAAVVILAELGDKTQLLAMAFAAKFAWKTVMAGVFVSTVLNHFLAVIVGVCLGSFIDTHMMQLVASLAFIVFGLWTIRGDKLEGEDQGSRFGPFGTVAVAFFLAEMGDKTQFATITLAARYQTVLPVLLGTTTGMMLADGFGILVGKALYKVIPAHMLKWLAALVFIGCGILGLYGALGGA